MPSLYLKVCFDLMFIILFSSFIHSTTQIELFSHTFFMPNGALNSLRTFCHASSKWLLNLHLEEWSVFIPIPKKGNAKECSSFHAISHASKVMLKILQARLPQ